MSFDALFFDLDGTRVDSAADLTTAVTRLRSELDEPCDFLAASAADLTQIFPGTGP